MGSLPLLARRQDFIGDMFSYGLIVSVWREFSANILERRRHVGESGLVELQHRDHVAPVGSGLYLKTTSGCSMPKAVSVASSVTTEAALVAPR